MWTLALLLLSVNVEADIRQAVNVERSKSGVSQLAESDSLSHAAQSHADYLATHDYRGDGGHTFGNGTSAGRAQAAGFRGTLLTPNPGHTNFVIGETLGYGHNTPEAVVASWRKSSAGHWKALLGPNFNVCGFGYARNTRTGERIWVGMFGQE